MASMSTCDKYLCVCTTNNDTVTSLASITHKELKDMRAHSQLDQHDTYSRVKRWCNTVHSHHNIDAHVLVEGLFKYKAKRDEEISFDEGELFYVLETPNEIWWRVKRFSDEGSGYVPASHVRIIDSLVEKIATNKFISPQDTDVKSSKRTWMENKSTALSKVMASKLKSLRQENSNLTDTVHKLNVRINQEHVENIFKRDSVMDAPLDKSQVMCNRKKQATDLERQNQQLVDLLTRVPEIINSVTNIKKKVMKKICDSVHSALEEIISENIRTEKDCNDEGHPDDFNAKSDRGRNPISEVSAPISILTDFCKRVATPVARRRSASCADGRCRTSGESSGDSSLFRRGHGRVSTHIDKRKRRQSMPMPIRHDMIDYDDTQQCPQEAVAKPQASMSRTHDNTTKNRWKKIRKNFTRLLKESVVSSGMIADSGTECSDHTTTTDRFIYKMNRFNRDQARWSDDDSYHPQYHSHREDDVNQGDTYRHYDTASYEQVGQCLRRRGETRNRSRSEYDDTIAEEQENAYKFHANKPTKVGIMKRASIKWRHVMKSIKEEVKQRRTNLSGTIKGKDAGDVVVPRNCDPTKRQARHDDDANQYYHENDDRGEPEHYDGSMKVDRSQRTINSRRWSIEPRQSTITSGKYDREESQSGNATTQNNVAMANTPHKGRLRASWCSVESVEGEDTKQWATEGLVLNAARKEKPITTKATMTTTHTISQSPAGDDDCQQDKISASSSKHTITATTTTTTFNNDNNNNTNNDNNDNNNNNNNENNSIVGHNCHTEQSDMRSPITKEKHTVEASAGRADPAMTSSPLGVTVAPPAVVEEVITSTSSDHTNNLELSSTSCLASRMREYEEYVQAHGPPESTRCGEVAHKRWSVGAAKDIGVLSQQWKQRRKQANASNNDPESPHTSRHQQETRESEPPRGTESHGSGHEDRGLANNDLSKHDVRARRWRELDVPASLFKAKGSTECFESTLSSAIPPRRIKDTATHEQQSVAPPVARSTATSMTSGMLDFALMRVSTPFGTLGTIGGGLESLAVYLRSNPHKETKPQTTASHDENQQWLPSQ